MKYTICAAALGVLLLTGCTAADSPAPSAPSAGAVSTIDRALTAEELGRDETTKLDAAGDSFSAVLHVGQGYSLYIPDDGWTLELTDDSDIPRDCWTADALEGVSLSIYHYADMSSGVARSRFLDSCGYVFEDLSGGETDDPLYGQNGAGSTMGLAVEESTNGTTYVIAWKYPAEGEAYGPILDAMAGSFELME